jgi:hypothetical protein
MEEAARIIGQVPGARAVVVTGLNEALRARLAADRDLAPAIVLGYRHDLLDLIAASDVVIQHAGGVTCLEAFALRTPVLMFHPIVGHGTANAARMAAAGVATVAADARELRALLDDPSFWTTAAPATVIRATALLLQPPLGDLLQALPAPVPSHPRRLRSVRPMRLALPAALVLGLLTAIDSFGDAAAHVAASLVP